MVLALTSGPTFSRLIFFCLFWEYGNAPLLFLATGGETGQDI